MSPIYRKLIFFVVPVFLPLFLGYGESEEEVVKVPKSPPQITITLRSDFTITQPLDPDPQYEKTEELKQEKVAAKTLILIGPEGDFSTNEIKMALQNQFKAVSLGESRLRTETAGIIAVHTINIKN